MESKPWLRPRVACDRRKVTRFSSVSPLSSWHQIETLEWLKALQLCTFIQPNHMKSTYSLGVAARVSPLHSRKSWYGFFSSSSDPYDWPPAGNWCDGHHGPQESRAALAELLTVRRLETESSLEKKTSSNCAFRLEAIAIKLEAIAIACSYTTVDPKQFVLFKLGTLCN